MRFSIITPSFRNSDWLRLCIPSVADQQGVELEHIVQDSCSDDGTQEWLPTDKRVKAFIEKDSGMYDAVNRGWKRATGELLAYINCDEQYLPGALKEVRDFFAANPGVDVVLADSIVTDSAGDYVCHRYSLVPTYAGMWVRFPVLTSSIFLRRSVIEKAGCYFDTTWRDLGDFFWILDMVKKGIKMAVLPKFTSIFTDTGENMNLKPNAIRERAIKDKQAPAWVKAMSLPLAVHYRMRLAARGSLTQKPFEFSLYTLNSPSRRVTRRAVRPTSFWKRRPGPPPSEFLANDSAMPTQ